MWIRASEAFDCRWSVLGLTYERGTRRASARSETSTPPACSPKPQPSRSSPAGSRSAASALAYQWAVLHPATADTGVETPGGPSTRRARPPTRRSAVTGPRRWPRSPRSPSPPRWAGLPTAARNLMADALDLPHRHPKLWKRVRRGQIPAWQARRVAQQTRRLPQSRCPVGRRPARPPDRLRTDHHRPARRPSRREVRPRRTPTPRRTGHRLIRRRAVPPRTRRVRRCQRPDRPRRHPDPAGLLRAGLRHRPPAVPSTATPAPWVNGRSRPSASSSPSSPAQGTLDLAASTSGKIKAYVHVEADDLDQTAVGTMEKLGAATLAKIKSWVGHHQVVIQPVLNLQRRDGVDSHDPPPWMRELVILRDGHCVFPGCTRDARSCDLDHIQPLRPRRPTRPDQTRQPRLPLQDDTTAPRPSDSGATPARPTATTSGTDPTASP